MALYIYEKNSNQDIGEVGYCFSSYEQIQDIYCDRIEKETLNPELVFLDNPNIKEYLAEYGITYCGNYKFQCDEWGTNALFCTYLNYPLQMSCVMLQRPDLRYVISDQFLFEKKYILPVLKKVDVYMLADNFLYFDIYALRIEDLEKNGIEIVINGESMKGRDAAYIYKYFSEIRSDRKYLSREIDAMCFPQDYESRMIFKPYVTNLKEYLIAADEMGAFLDEIEELDNSYDLSAIKVKANDNIQFDGSFRRYPIHFLIETDSGWIYNWELSWKYPTLTELFDNMLFHKDRYGCNTENGQPIAVADKINASNVMIMVQDCDEYCDIREWWKGDEICFVIKYNHSSKTLEICDKAQGILEFHNLFQSSTNL